jgi:hypothetical protein
VSVTSRKGEGLGGFWGAFMMFSAETIKHHALLMGVETGQMPEVEFIWSIQKSEGEQRCFGQGVSCPKLDCRWLRQCMALTRCCEKELLTK